MMSEAFVVGVGCCLGAASLTLLYYSERANKEAQFLTSATRLSLNKLVKLFDSDGAQLLPDIVAVSGRVGSSTPMACKLSGLQAVLLEEKAEVQFERKNDGDGVWIPDSTSCFMPSDTKEVPWYLEDGTGQVVYIRGARGAHHFSFAAKGETFEEYPKTDDSNHKFIKMIGVKRTESLLPIGTSLTVVGQAVKDEGGRVWIQPPPEHQGRFYVLRMTIDELVAYLRHNGRWFKNFSQFFMISVGFVLVLGCLTVERKHPKNHVPSTIKHSRIHVTEEIKHPDSCHSNDRAFKVSCHRRDKTSRDSCHSDDRAFKDSCNRRDKTS